LIIPPQAFEDHPADCPEWEYERHPDRATVRTHIQNILSELLLDAADTLAMSIDTRGSHGRIFRQVTPLAHEYFAGHYRGENFRCLRFYRVGVEGDARVGAAPQAVAHLVVRLAEEIRAGVSALDANVAIDQRQRLRYILALAARVFVAFLTIHPYANGNGHIARLTVWCIMGRYDFWPRRWTVEPRPPNPPYLALITACRSGNPGPLEQYLLQALTT